MKTSIIKSTLCAALLAAASAATAQELNSAYFTEDFKYRHQLNPAFGNEQGYFGLSPVSNLNVKVQGNFGIDAFLKENPNFGKPGEKRTVTFLHPSISYDDAMSGFSDDALKLSTELRLQILSFGFKGFGGYNTFELTDKTMIGLSLPKSLVEFAKNVGNKEYSFDDLAFHAHNYAEIALGHSHDLNEKLRIGVKLKALVGLANADLHMENMSANLTGDTWTLQGKAVGELSMKGASFTLVENEYKNRFQKDADGAYKLDPNGEKIPETYQKVDDIDVDGAGIGGFGGAIDLGGVYKLNDDITLSAALTDLGFISWSNTIVAETSGEPFQFEGFKDVALKSDYAGDGETFKSAGQNYGDQIKDFLNLEDKGDGGGKTEWLNATLNIGAEYRLPFYRKLTAGLLFQHHFCGDHFSWTEGRLSANWTPLRWLDGGVNIGTNTYATSLGWVINIHPKVLNLFVGMDQIITKTNKDYIPVGNPSFNFVMGMNIAWGGGKKKAKQEKEKAN